MIHFAIGMFVLSLTVAACKALTFVLPSIADAQPLLWTGAIAAVASSGALLYFVPRWRA